ncbi:hypothetical protein TE10_12405 [Raoultella ornithinolytica]|uniref:hypothetical protein n=1 Tax=Raoultella ornithinolytica TaxID=54291 RepID=UPI000598150F|nr:hypothetical protein TE10_12405 [Raoultella ornithinolytica]
MTGRLSKLEINRIIKQINRMNLDDADYEYIKSLFIKMTEGLRFFVQRRVGADSLYHVRRTGGEKVTMVDQILAPPSSIVVNYQRCNPPGQARFYAASTRMTAIKESRCEVGEIIYIGQWINKADYPVSAALSTNEELFNFDSQSNEDVFYAYIDALFTRRIHSTFSNDYKLTSALSEILMSGLPKSIDNEDGLIALKFPSTVSHGTNVHNTVVHPSFLAKKFELMHVLECEVVNGDNNEITALIKDTAIDFDEGEIIWTGSSNVLPCLLCSDGARMFVNDNGRLKIATIDFEPDADFIIEFLNE